MLCKVSIVDDHALFRRGVLDILRQTEEYEIVAERFDEILDEDEFGDDEDEEEN